MFENYEVAQIESSVADVHHYEDQITSLENMRKSLMNRPDTSETIVWIDKQILHHKKEIARIKGENNE